MRKRLFADARKAAILAWMDRHASDGTAIVAAIREGRMTSVEVAETCLRRIAVRDEKIGAWAHVDPTLVRQRAAAADEVRAALPLRGLPVGVKDVLLTCDMPTEYNCRLYRGHAPALDAAAVRLLRQAGAVMIGKTATVELASVGAPPSTRNPHNPEHTPGGSSSGSAAAVADWHVPVSLGTQTGGSIIRPASFCGVWALKPTWGLVCTEGAKPFAPSLDTIGWFGRSARDLMLLLDTFDPRPPAPPLALAGARIAIWRPIGWARAGEDTRDALGAATAMLTRAGAHVEDFAPPAFFARLARAHRTIMIAEGARSFLAEYRVGPERLGTPIVDLVRSGLAISAARLRSAHDVAARARIAFDAVSARYDAILCPSTLGPAPRGLAATGDLIFNGQLTLLHAPCVNVPLWHAANGLPIGLTLTGPRYADRHIVALAECIGQLR